MIKNLFLVGDIGTGKSSVIKENLIPHLEQVGGFFVQRIYNGSSCGGFRLLPVSSAGEYELKIKPETLNGLKNIFLMNDGSGNWHSNMDIFMNAGVRYINDSVNSGKKIILLDEIGGIELHCSQFLAAVRGVISGPVPVIGVLKAPKNAGILEECKAGRGVADINKMFVDDLKKDYATKLLTADRSNMDYVSEYVKDFVEAAVN